MQHRCLALFALAPLCAFAQSACPQVNFLTARSVNLKPSATTHIDVVRQSDGSYTGYEVTDAAPYRTVNATAHFEQQFTTCFPHELAGYGSSTAPPGAENPPGAGSQMQVSTTLSNGKTFVARISDDSLHYTVYFDIFDAQHNLLSETPFTSVVSPPGYVGSANEMFESLALADLNGDGNLDLLAVFDTPLAQGIAYGGVWTFLGNGDGTFQAGKRQVLASQGQLAAAQMIAVGDLNGDGKPDLVIGRSSFAEPPFVIAFGNGDGTFNAQTQSLSAPCGPAAVIADLNHDGKADLVLAPCTNQQVTNGIAVLLGNGDGTFQTPGYYPVLIPVNARAPFVPVAVGDVSGDGNPDIVTAGGTILFGDGRGGFPSYQYYAQAAAASVVLGDFDGDGKTDIILGSGNPGLLSGSNSYPTLTVLFGSGGGAFAGPPVSAVESSNTMIAAADFHGGGTEDVVIASQSSHVVTVLAGAGNGHFLDMFTKTFDVGSGVVSIAAADFNHDGKPDLAVLTAAGQVQIFPNLGGSSFGPAYVVPVPSNSLDAVAAADINGDGIPDLVVTAGDTIFIWLAKGDGTFGAPMSVQQANVVQQAIAFGDFNGDGKLDIASAAAGGFSVTVLLGKGDGTFPNLVSTPLACQAQGTSGDIVAADFNGDGRLDLAVACNARSHPFIETLLGQGNGQFSEPSLSQGGISGLAVADINGDGIPDLISGNGTSGGLSVQLGNGDGTFQSGVAIFPVAGATAVADFNQDGTPDVAMMLPGTGVAVFLNISQPPAPLTVVSAATFAPGPLAAGEIATAFGEIIPSGTGSGLTGGILSVTVQDSSGNSRSATVLYLSKSQINFVMPNGLANGPATVMVSTSGMQLTAQVQIVPTAPALFSVGSGIAAAYVVQVAPDGTQTVQPVFDGNLEPVPIDVTQPGQTYLTLFGTGFGLATTGYMAANVQGVAAQVTYAGPQPNSQGLDQVNILLPASLAGAGVASVTIGGFLGSGPFPPAYSNTVYATIR